MLFFVESFTLYLYYYGWDRWKQGRAKLGHWTLGILLNVWGTIVMFIANSWLTYMMTPPRDITPTTDPTRSEEHTSELQSLAYLVCRLLLEKKKNPQPQDRSNYPCPTQLRFAPALAP